MKVWDLESGRLWGFLGDHDDWVNEMAVTPDGKTVVSGSDDKTVKIWDLATGRKRHTLRGHISEVTAVALTPDGKIIVSGSRDTTVKVWDLATGREQHTLNGHSSWVTAVAVTPDGRTIVSGSADRTVKVWDLATGRERYTLDDHAEGVTAVVVTPDGKTIVSGSYDKTVMVWDLESGTQITRFSTEGGISACAVSDIQNTIVAGDKGGFIYLIRLENTSFGTRIVTGQRNAKGGAVTVQCPCCDGRQIVRDGEPGTVVICPSCTRPLRLNPFVVDMWSQRTVFSRLRDHFFSRGR